MSRTHRRVVAARYGGPEVLEVVREPIPEPRAGEVRIRVTRCGVAFGDVMRRKGTLAPRAPFTPGYDVVGVVEGGGPEWDGVRVAHLLRNVGVGGYAEHVCARPADLVRIPDDVDDDKAIALVMNYVSAWQIVHRVARLQPGQRLLVQGASGGVGTALLDVGRHAGLALYGTASARKHDVVRSYGAEPIDYKSEDVAARTHALCGGADTVADPIGGEGLYTSHDALRKGGMLVFFGFTADIERGLWGLLAGFARVLWLKLRLGKRVRSYGLTVPPLSSYRKSREDLAQVLAAAKSFTPVMGGRFELAEANKAHASLDSGAAAGKLLLYVDPEAR